MTYHRPRGWLRCCGVVCCLLLSSRLSAFVFVVLSWLCACRAGVLSVACLRVDGELCCAALSSGTCVAARGCGKASKHIMRGKRGGKGLWFVVVGRCVVRLCCGCVRGMHRLLCDRLVAMVLMIDRVFLKFFRKNVLFRTCFFSHRNRYDSSFTGDTT